MNLENEKLKEEILKRLKVLAGKDHIIIDALEKYKRVSKNELIYRPFISIL